MWKKIRKRHKRGKDITEFFSNKFQHEITNFDETNLTLDLHTRNATTDEIVSMSLLPPHKFHCECDRYRTQRLCHHIQFLRRCFRTQSKKNANQ